MTINFRLALLEIAQGIGREIRSDYPLSYPHALEALADLEDKLTALAGLIPEDRLCVRPLGYLPARHPKALANTLAGSLRDAQDEQEAD